MKKEMQKKLSINKETVSDLNKEGMNSVKGGADSAIITALFKCFPSVNQYSCNCPKTEN